MQNRQFNLPSLGSWLTIIALTQNKWSGFVCVHKMLPTTVLSPRELLGCSLFWKYWLLNLGNQTTKATCCLREVMGCTSETHCSSARDISSVSCILVCFISCMCPLFLLKKKRHKNQNNGYCLPENDLWFYPGTQNSSVSSTGKIQHCSPVLLIKPWVCCTGVGKPLGEVSARIEAPSNKISAWDPRGG